MSIGTLLKTHDIEALCAGAVTAITRGHSMARWISGRAGSDKVREEDFVATMVTDTIEPLAEQWSPILASAGIQLRITGAFVHGQPQVKIDGAATPVELADVLLVHHHIAPGATRSRALLLQAKMSKERTKTLALPDDQLTLYQEWPPFNFKPKPLRTPKDRVLTNMDQACRYALVYDGGFYYRPHLNWADHCPWSTCAPSAMLSTDRSLARVMVDMLLDKDGRQFDPAGASHDAWSVLVHDLLDHLKEKLYTRASLGRSGPHRPNRINGVAMPVVSGTVLSFASWNDGSAQSPNESQSLSARYINQPVTRPRQPGDPDEPPPGPPRDDRPDGGSVILIETYGKPTPG